MPNLVLNFFFLFSFSEKRFDLQIKVILGFKKARNSLLYDSLNEMPSNIRDLMGKMASYFLDDAIQKCPLRFHRNRMVRALIVTSQELARLLRSWIIYTV